MKFLIAFAFVGILGALGLAGIFMLRDGRDGRDGKPKTGNMMRALAWRVGLSVLLFAFILFSYWVGWIRPTGIPIGR
ncbi:MAG TPA: twin transmembrane helix small protein [Burkholderiaceae bacterium]